MTCPSCGHDGLPPLVCEHCGHRWYATPAPLDVDEHYVGDGCDGITMTEHNAPEIVHPAPFEDDSEWASLGNIECRCGDVFPTVEAMHEHIHLSHPNADHDVLDIPPTIAEAYEQGMLAERALATPAPLDVDRLARALFVICAACEPGEEYTDNHHRRHAEAIADAYAEEAPDEGNEWQERNE